MKMGIGERKEERAKREQRERKTERELELRWRGMTKLG
jgi:hypothetical protein